MPVPKRQHSKARRDSRQACKFIRPGQFAQCTNCTKAVGQHQVCSFCGFYKGRKVLVTSAERLAQRKETRQAAEAKAAANQSAE